MDDDDLFLAMLGLAIAAVMLVAGALFLIARHETGEPVTQPVPAVIFPLEDVHAFEQLGASLLSGVLPFERSACRRLWRC